jgi:transposase
MVQVVALVRPRSPTGSRSTKDDRSPSNVCSPIGAHIRMFRFYGAAPHLLVPDNLKSGINKASFYDPK